MLLSGDDDLLLGYQAKAVTDGDGEASMGARRGGKGTARDWVGVNCARASTRLTLSNSSPQLINNTFDNSNIDTFLHTSLSSDNTRDRKAQHVDRQGLPSLQPQACSVASTHSARMWPERCLQGKAEVHVQMDLSRLRVKAPVRCRHGVTAPNIAAAGEALLRRR